jgi:hypothetical protein
MQTGEKIPLTTVGNRWKTPRVYGRLRHLHELSTPWFRILAASLLMVGVSPPPAAAAPPAGGDAAPADRRESDAGSALSGSGKKITLDDTFTVEGTLEKPSAFYILRRSALDYDWARLDARLSPLVLESVQDPLF